ncbi:MAG TPA: hypothetical protein DCZ95_11010 [Verrucomicrobia bacterium]|nr:MAG: hypothetical protein A2X46_07975 [Lentisphaerae bacterium GWF2_57_35]HBA84614.1 hypothetical protein [Verrucomicrobiota bacterium]
MGRLLNGDILNVAASSLWALWMPFAICTEAFAQSDALLFSENFESGALISNWSTYSTGQGQIELSTNFSPCQGNRHLAMDDMQSDEIFSLNELVLTLDLSGSSNLWLSFHYRNLHDETHAMPEVFSGHCNADGAAASSDGGLTWHRLADFHQTGSDLYQFFDQRLDGLHPDLHPVANFMIKFQQYDDAPADEDGLALDDIRVRMAQPLPAADLAMNLQASAASVAVSNYLHYTIRVWNNGPADAGGITITNSLSENIEFLSASPGGSYQEELHQIVFQIPSLAKFAATEVSFLVRPWTSGTAFVTSKASGAGTDLTATNNEAIAIVNIFSPTDPAVDLALQMTVLEETEDNFTLGLAVIPGSSVTCQVAVVRMDAEETVASNVMLRLLLPPESTALSYPPGTKLCGRELLCPLGDLASLSSTNASVIFSVSQRGSNFITGWVYCDSPESAPANNGGANSVFVSPSIRWEQVLGSVVDGEYLSAAYIGNGGSEFKLLDYDSDGDLDLFSPGQLWENKGTRHAPMWTKPKNFGLPFQGDYGDLDGDGELEAVWCTHSSSEPFTTDLWLTDYVFSNSIPTGSSSNQLVDSFFTSCWRNPPVLCDIDGDGLQDLFIDVNTYTESYEYTNSIWFYHNTGTVHEAQWAPPDTQYLASCEHDYVRLQFWDVGNDGDYDLMVLPIDANDYHTNIYFYENIGSRTTPVWATPTQMEHDVGCEFKFWAMPAFGDMDADGDIDMFAMPDLHGWVYGSALEYYENRATNGIAQWVKTGKRLWFDVGNHSAPALGDVDGDGDLDLFVGRYDWTSSVPGDLLFYRNEGSPSCPAWQFEPEKSFYRLAEASYPKPAFCDMDGDGLQDLFVGTDNQLLCFKNTGTVQEAYWAAPFAYESLDCTNAPSPAFCDINGDGLQDLFVTKTTVVSMGPGWTRWVELQCYINTGTLTEAQWRFAPEMSFSDTYWYLDGVAFSDADGDGDQDMLISMGIAFMGSPNSRCLFLYENLGSPTNAVWAKDIRNRLLIYNDKGDGFTGISIGDLDADGDLDWLLGNWEGGLRFCRNTTPKLQISPSDRTLEPGEGCDFDATGASGPLEWSFIRSTSGGTLQTNSGLYMAGPTNGLDMVQATATNGLIGRAFINVMGSNTLQSSDCAILIAGRNTTYSFDPVWRATDYLANSAYNTLRYFGYSKASIRYLSPVSQQDVDGNGLFDDIDLESALAHVSQTFTNWANGSSNLFLYLVDHGGVDEGIGYMRLSPEEVLSATSLAVWLNDLQNTYGTRVSVVMDFCNAGRFLPALAWTGSASRVVIAASAAHEPTYFVAGGLVSFSETFFNALLQGLNLNSAFRLARDAVSGYQQACLDDNGDGVFDKDVDGAQAAASTLKTSASIHRDIPQIADSSPNQELNGAASVALWVSGVSGAYPIDAVWAMVVPPGYNPDPTNPIVDLPEVPLYYNTLSSRYEVCYDGFSQPGTYQVIYYARDVLGSMSLPKYGSLHQNGLSELAILVAGGPTNSPGWPAIDAASRCAYHTLLARRFSDESLSFLSAAPYRDFNADGTNDVDGSVSRAALSLAITNGAAGADKLTVYLTGVGTNGTLQMEDAEHLTSAELDGWLDIFQTNGSPVTVVMDFAGCGSFVTNMSAPPGAERILIAGSGIDEPSVHYADLGFSQIFLSYLFNGANIRDAFRQARDGLFNLTHGLQDPLLDDNDNGTPNEKTEGERARTRYIGAAFVTGADTPVIGSITPDAVLASDNELLLWADEIVDADGLSAVWCVITPPDYEGNETLISVDLAWNETTSRYEAEYSGFSSPGVYACSFFAMDALGEISSPRQCEVLSADAYEPDNHPAQAGFFDRSGYQHHNFHQAYDEDWVFFYAPTGYPFEIRTVQLGTNVDTVLELYRQNPDRSLTLMAQRDSQGAGRGQGEYLLLESPTNAFYYVRASPYDRLGVGSRSEYDLQIGIPSAGIGRNLIVIAVDRVFARPLPSGAWARLDEATAYFGESMSLEFTGLSAGTHALDVPSPDGYRPMEDPKTPGQVQNAASSYGNPRSIRMSVDSAWNYACFCFEPYIQIQGLVRDGWSRQRLNGLHLSFTPLSGPPAAWPDNVHDGYPNEADYKSLWITEDGRFPTNVLLPPVDWSLSLHLDGYSNRLFSALITNTDAGRLIDLGELSLPPLDQNANSLPDRWEAIAFGSMTNAAADDDSDADGMDNWSEYLTGTDPDNVDSLFKFDRLASTTSDFQCVTLSWQATPGHAYRIMGSDHLASNSWSLLAGPWTNQTQTFMSWSDTNEPAACRSFRVEESRP